MRTLFLSDFHLGTRGCQASQILAFLKHYDADTIYLIGDIVDGWRLKASWHWPTEHNVVVQKLLRKARKGTRIVYIPGNHDEFLRPYCGDTFGGIELREEDVYLTALGERVLILHGDKFDTVVRNVKWLAHFGDWAYDFAIFVNGHVNTARRWLGMPYWSFSAAAKQKVKKAVSFISAFEQAVVADAKHQNAQIVICGHIHHPSQQMLGDIRYFNTGDWVESCTAVVEHGSGALELIRWADLCGSHGTARNSVDVAAAAELTA